jgi:pilus assembly protein Flp/PilA
MTANRRLTMKFINKLFRDEAGATAIEYGLIAALIAVAAITAMQGLGGELQTTFNTTSTAMAGANGA